MANQWNTTILDSEEDIYQTLTSIRGKRWLCRGQSKPFGSLIPSIDREPRRNLSRPEKLALERQSIDIFRSTARFFTDQGERNSLFDDIAALMVLRHYGVPTRLLDWSQSPYVATYFATCDNDSEDGEIWVFDEPLYEIKGGAQWKKWPETTIDGSGEGLQFRAELTAFTYEDPPDWFICNFYAGFPRQNAQSGAYTMTARFGRDHAEAIANLFDDSSSYHLYIVRATIKKRIREQLRKNHGVWRGSLFPDTSGAAETAGMVFRNIHDL